MDKDKGQAKEESMTIISQIGGNILIEGISEQITPILEVEKDTLPTGIKAGLIIRTREVKNARNCKTTQREHVTIKILLHCWHSSQSQQLRQK